MFLTIIMTERHPFHTLPRAYTSETPPTHLRDTSVSLDFDLLLSLDMLLYPTEMDIQFVQVLQQCSQRCTLGHLGKGVDILGEALATDRPPLDLRPIDELLKSHRFHG